MNLLVNRDGQVSVDKKAISFADLITLLTNRYSLNTNLPVYITGATGRHARLGGFCSGFGETRRHLARRHRRQSRPRPTMKNFQQNLLIVLALALCGLCAYQWYEQTIQREEITTLNGMVYDKNAAIQDATNSIATLNHQVDADGRAPHRGQSGGRDE